MNTREQVLAVAAELRSQIGYFACEGSAGKDWANHLADKLEKIMAQTQQPAAWLHEVVAGDGEPDQALSFSKDNFPLEGVVGYRSIGCEPLYRAAVEPIEGEREAVAGAVLIPGDGVSLVQKGQEDHWCAKRGALRLYTRP